MIRRFSGASTRAPLRGALLLALLAGAVAASAQSQSWEYKAYQKDRLSGQYTKDRFVSATVSIEEKDGKASFRMITPGRGDPCISRSDLPADVQRTADTVTVTVTPTMAGCEPFRYVIRNDGSGGIKQNRRGEGWVTDGMDHGLTPVK